MAVIMILCYVSDAMLQYIIRLGSILKMGLFQGVTVAEQAPQGLMSTALTRTTGICMS